MAVIDKKLELYAKTNGKKKIFLMLLYFHSIYEGGDGKENSWSNRMRTYHGNSLTILY